MRACFTIWTIARVDECFSCHLQDLPWRSSGIGKFELSGNLAQWGVA